MSNIPRGRVPGKGFTLIEVLVVIAIIGVLVALVFVAVGGVLRTARSSGEAQLVRTIRDGVLAFKNDHGILPPLVDDSEEPDEATSEIPVRDAAFMRYEKDRDEPRYSTHSITFYLVGVLGKEFDGVDGPGITKPLADGTFERRGARFPSYLDTASTPDRLVVHPEDGRVDAIQDRWKTDIRYYRWKSKFFETGTRTGEMDQLFMPRVLGEPSKASPEMRAAEFAVVSLGENKVTDERKPLPSGGRSDPGTDDAALDTKATGDDIVEVGS